MKTVALLALLGALTLPAAVAAQEQPAAAADQAQPAAATQTAKAEKPRKICKSDADAPATRLGTPKTCKTQEEWDRIEGRKPKARDAAAG
jgi:hypothetical protein